jgi:uncharacterized membrane protein
MELWAACFLVVGGLWFLHHTGAGLQKQVDALGLGLGLGFLMGLALLPFSITVVADYPTLPVSLIWFWGNVLLAGACVALQLARILRLDAEVLHPLLAHPPRQRLQLVEVALVPTVALICMGLAVVHPRLSLWAWVPLLLVPVALVRSRQPHLPPQTQSEGEQP